MLFGAHGLLSPKYFPSGQILHWNHRRVRSAPRIPQRSGGAILPVCSLKYLFCRDPIDQIHLISAQAAITAKKRTLGPFFKPSIEYCRRCTKRECCDLDHFLHHLFEQFQGGIPPFREPQYPVVFRPCWIFVVGAPRRPTITPPLGKIVQCLRIVVCQKGTLQSI